MATVSAGRNAARKARYLMECQRTYYREPLTLVSGSGSYVTDDAGRRYLDFFAGIAVLLVGHSHPKVNAAVHDQIDKLTHTSTLYLTEPMLDLAERLVEAAPAGLDKVFFGNSGTEANEVAAALARHFTGAKGFIALDHAYHGRSAWTIGVSGLSAYRNFGAEPQHVAFAPNAYCYRCPLQLTYPSCGIACAKAIEGVIEAQPAGDVAAFYAETIQGVGGIITPPPEYYAIVKEILDRHGILFIADEVLCGAGRTGKFFALEHYRARNGGPVVPDIITLGKSLNGGYSPLSALLVKTSIVDTIARGSGSFAHAQTYSHNPLAAAAALATMHYVHNKRLVERAALLGAELQKSLKTLLTQGAGAHIVGDVRGIGMLAAVELVADRETKKPFPRAMKVVETLIKECLAHGLVVWPNVGHANGHDGDLVMIAPPFTITLEEIDELTESLRGALAATAAAVLGQALLAQKT